MLGEGGAKLDSSAPQPEYRQLTRRASPTKCCWLGQSGPAEFKAHFEQTLSMCEANETATHRTIRFPWLSMS